MIAPLFASFLGLVVSTSSLYATTTELQQISFELARTSVRYAEPGRAMTAVCDDLLEGHSDSAAQFGYLIETENIREIKCVGSEESRVLTVSITYDMRNQVGSGTVGLLHVDAEVKVLGLPLGLDTAATKPGQVVEGTRGRESFIFQQYSDGQPRRFGPTTPQMIDALSAQLRDMTSRLLSEARAAISGAGTDEAGCRRRLGCPVNAAVSTTLSLVNGVLGVLDTAIPNVADGMGAEGQVVDGLLDGLLDLDIANADLRLLDIDCRGGVRLGL
ncbi:MAG: hypothetical protein ACT4OK_22355 [Gemmobacter sp.]